MKGRLAVSRVYEVPTMVRAAIVGVAMCLALCGGLCQAAGGPREGWKFAFRDFVIAAWNPPAASDAEYKVYREAGCNLVMSPRYELPDKALELAARHGLRVMVDTYTPNDKPWGGTASRYTPHPTHHPATLPELKWLHARYGTNPALAGYLLGDDYGAIPPELVETTEFLHTQAPQLFPWICQNVMSAETLAAARNPIQDPQIYPTLYQKDWPAGEQAQEYCRQLQRLRQGCRKHGLIPWPMLNVCGVESDSLVRFQVYSALAYGAQGIWYFTYRDGLAKGCGYATEAEVRRSLLPTWAIAAEANRRVAGWGKALLGRTCAGLFQTGQTPPPHCAAPGAGKLVERMSDDLLVGVLTPEASGSGDTPLLMVVDTRVDKLAGALPMREVELGLSPSVGGVRPASPGAAWSPANSVRLSLPAGGGELLALRGTGLGKLCEGIEPGARPSQGQVTLRADGLVMALSFDEGKGEIAHDSSGAQNHVWVHGAKWGKGKVGGGLSFTGGTSYGQLTEAYLPATEAMSIAAWVRPTYPETGYGPVVVVGGGNSRFEFGFGPDNIYPVISDGKSHSEGKLYVSGMRQLIPPGTWGHIAVCAGPQGATTYVNGRLVAHTDYVGRFALEPCDVYLGMRGAERYTGDLADVRIWTRCLTADEVAALAQR